MAINFLASGRLSLRKNLIIAFFLIFFIPITLLGTVTMLFISRILENRFHAEHMAVLQSIHDNIVERNKNDMERILSMLALDPDLPHVFDDPEARKKVQGRWDDILLLYPERAWIYFGDEKNRILVAPDWTADENYDLRIRPWYLGAKDSREPVWLEPVVEYVSGDIVITVAMAIHGSDQEFLGVLAVDTFLNTFLESLTDQSNSREIPIIVTDEYGYIVSMNSIGRSIPGILSSYPLETASHDKGNYTITLNGSVYLVSLLDITDLNLKILSLLPMADITREIRPIALFTLLIFSLGLGAAVFAAYLMSRSFVRRFEMLGAYLHRVNDGEYDNPLSMDGHGEFQDFSEHLNSVIQKLTFNIETVNLLFHLLSHSISNSIMVVSDKARHIRSGEGVPELDAQIIYQQSESIRGLIENLLVSHNLVFRGEEIINREAVSVVLLVTEVILQLKERADAKDQIINFQYQSHIPPILTDNNLLRDVFENLLYNAVKFSGQGTDIELTLFTSDGRVHLDIADQGPGFTEEDRSLLFQRNTKLSAQPTAGEASHGIGLYLVKQILDLLNCSIELLDREEPGACFRVSMPIYDTN